MFIIIHLENYTKPRLSTLYVCLFQNIVCQDCCSALHCFFTARNAWCCQSAKPEIIQISGRNVARLCHHGTYTLTLLGGSAYPLRPVSCDCDNFHRWFSFHERCDIGHALVRKKTQKKTLPVRKQRPWTNMSATLPLGTQFIVDPATVQVLSAKGRVGQERFHARFMSFLCQMSQSRHRSICNMQEITYAKKHHSSQMALTAWTPSVAV